MKKTNLVWRLPSKLTLDDIQKMIELKIISPEEAKELTFNSSDDNEKVKALEEQVKFLKELVDKLSTQSPQVIWRYVETYRPSYPVWSTSNLLGNAYTVLCSTASGSTLTTGSNSVNATYTAAGTGGTTINNKVN